MGDQLGFPSARSGSSYVTEAEAADILGAAAVLTNGQSRHFWEPEEEIHVIESILFSREALLECAAENEAGSALWRLVYILGLSPLEILSKVGLTARLITPQVGSIKGPDVAVVNDRREPALCNGGANFIIKQRSEKWSRSSRPSGWRLIDLHPRHCRRTWSEQTALLAAGSTRPMERAHARDVIEAVLALWDVTGVEHLPESAHWGFPRAKGEPPIMVATISEGVYVNAIIADTVEFYSWLGVCAQIAPNHPNLSPTA